MPFDIPWEDSYWDHRQEEYDEGESWAIQCIDVAKEEDEYDWLDELEEDEEE